MKRNNLAKCVVLGLAVLIATAAFASNKGSLHVQEAVEVNGQSLPAGDYQVRWEGTGSDVQLSFMQGKKEVAKTSANSPPSVHRYWLFLRSAGSLQWLS